jgi:hypothetical protein
MDFDDVLDEVDWAFDQMERTVARFRERGYAILADAYSAEWVGLNDDFHAARSKGGDGDDVLEKLLDLEARMIEAEAMLNSVFA